MAVKTINGTAHAVQLDVTDHASITPRPGASKASSAGSMCWSTMPASSANFPRALRSNSG
jgi:hypothetical protein